MVNSLRSGDALRACEAAFGRNERCAPTSQAAIGRITGCAAAITAAECGITEF